MRLSTDEDRDETGALATIRAAAEAGITVFDTARAYAPPPDAARLGENERLLARALGQRGRPVRVITKGGMARPGGAWRPDGRAKAIRSDCEASLDALGPLGIDLYLLHAPDPRTPWPTSVRALGRLHAEGLVARVGLSNVTVRQLDEACALAPVSAVEIALSVLEDGALRGGVLDRCVEAGITVIAHSPLGGPRRARTLARQDPLAAVAAAHEATPAEIALAWLLHLSDHVVAIPGARQPAAARSAARAATLVLSEEDRATLARAFGRARRQPSRAVPAPAAARVVLVMGIPGAGKSRVARAYVEDGYARLNRDELGGSLRDLAGRLGETLVGGSGRVLVDSTYLTRVARSYVIEMAARHRAAVRCVWLDTPLEQAQVNLVERLLQRFGELPSPEELRVVARQEPGLLMPTSQMRTVRELEPPTIEEGFTEVERMPFVRAAVAGRTAAGVLVVAGALVASGWEEALGDADPAAPHLLYDWRPDGGPETLSEAAAALSQVVTGPVEVAVCPHGAGPPSCWCRPPLPGLALAFAQRWRLDLARITVVGSAPAARTLARALGARHVSV